MSSPSPKPEMFLLHTFLILLEVRGVVTSMQRAQQQALGPICFNVALSYARKFERLKTVLELPHQKPFTQLGNALALLVLRDGLHQSVPGQHAPTGASGDAQGGWPRRSVRYRSAPQPQLTHQPISSARQTGSRPVAAAAPRRWGSAEHQSPLAAFVRVFGSRRHRPCAGEGGQARCHAACGHHWHWPGLLPRQ